MSQHGAVLPLVSPRIRARFEGPARRGVSRCAAALVAPARARGQAGPAELRHLPRPARLPDLPLDDRMGSQSPRPGLPRRAIVEPERRAVPDVPPAGPGATLGRASLRWREAAGSAGRKRTHGGTPDGTIVGMRTHIGYRDGQQPSSRLGTLLMSGSVRLPMVVLPREVTHDHRDGKARSGPPAGRR